MKRTNHASLCFRQFAQRCLNNPDVVRRLSGNSGKKYLILRTPVFAAL